MDEFDHPVFAPSSHVCKRNNEESRGANEKPVVSTLGERIELLDGETRSCWRRVDELEDEEASLNQRLLRLEKIRRGERMEILGLERACKAAEMAMLKAQEEAADLDAKSHALARSAQDAAEDTTAAAASALEPQAACLSNGAVVDNSSRLEGPAALVAVLSKMPSHEEKRRKLMSLLHETENQTRSQIAEAARSAAELRRSAKTMAAQGLPLELEATALRKELAEMAGADEIQARMVRAGQVGEGLQRRLHHANHKLATVRQNLAQGSARHLEEEEQRSLELMQGISQAKSQLHSRADEGINLSSNPSFPNRGGRQSAASAPRLLMQSSRGASQKNQGHDQSKRSPSRPSRQNWQGWA